MQQQQHQHTLLAAALVSPAASCPTSRKRGRHATSSGASSTNTGSPLFVSMTELLQAATDSLETPMRGDCESRVSRSPGEDTLSIGGASEQHSSVGGDHLHPRIAHGLHPHQRPQHPASGRIPALQLSATGYSSKRARAETFGGTGTGAAQVMLVCRPSLLVPGPSSSGPWAQAGCSPPAPSSATRSSEALSVSSSPAASWNPAAAAGAGVAAVTAGSRSERGVAFSPAPALQLGSLAARRSRAISLGQEASQGSGGEGLRVCTTLARGSPGVLTSPMRTLLSNLVASHHITVPAAAAAVAQMRRGEAGAGDPAAEAAEWLSTPLVAPSSAAAASTAAHPPSLPSCVYTVNNEELGLSLE